MSLIDIQQEGPVRTVTLNRPEKRNALSDELVQGLQVFFTTVPQSVQVIVVHGAGDHFCAGLDLNEVKEPVGVNFETSMIGQQLNNAKESATFYLLEPK